MRTAGSFCIAPDHPCLPGHFPGRPIVPGVVLLDEALALVLAAHPHRGVVGLPSVKFVHPVLPTQSVTVSCEAGSCRAGSCDAGTEQRVAFTCSVASQVVLHGSVQLGRAA